MAPTSTLGRIIRNPLVVFGLVVLAGDGPLVVAYGLAQDTSQGWAALVALIAFVFAMGGFFCYLVACKPRHLYAPGEIPESAFGTSIFRDENADAALVNELEQIQARADDKVEQLRATVSDEIAGLASRLQGTGDAVDELRQRVTDQVDKAIEETRATERTAQEERDLVIIKRGIQDLFIRGGRVRLSSEALLDMMEERGYGESAVREARDRLVSEGFLTRRDDYNKTHYRLSRKYR